MQLWISVHLPLLPLETIRPHWCEPGSHALLENDRVVVMTPGAEADGVRAGMRRGGVKALSPDAVLHERDLQQEQAALEGVALTLLQYTPEVAYADRHSLLLDITASLRAFGGRLALCRRVRASVHDLGFTGRIGLAPTAQGAWLLAVHENRPPLMRGRRVLRMRHLHRLLDALPFTLLPAASPYCDWLQGIGCRKLGDLRRLPRGGLQRRCGPALLEQLDCAYGEAPELFDWVQAPQRFFARIELPDRIEHTEGILFGARRLVLQLTGWLAAQQLAVARFVLQLEHERGRKAVPPTPLEIALSEPAWQEAHLVRLLKERLGRLVLEAPVMALNLEATHLSGMMPPTESLFPEPGGTPADYHRLLELLTARLGTENVLTAAPEADHRPEVCNRWLPTDGMAGKHRPLPTMPLANRPFWLLEKPIALLLRDHRPFYGSPLRLISGPERIECGWWDERFAVRDYFVAQGSDAACYWVYRERTGVQDVREPRWFLHGLFA